MKAIKACSGLLTLLALFGTAGAQAQTLALNKGEHVCIIGNTLGERMQHHGWLETRIHARFPAHNLVFRNLAYPGDELTRRLRSKNFGTPDQWLSGSAPIPQPDKIVDMSTVRENRFELADTRADVVFAFFGYNESHGGAQGLDKFKRDLDNTLKGMLGQKYNGHSAPRIVLFSPIGHEDLRNPNLSDGRGNNANLMIYTEAMAEVARANNVLFADLFTPSLDLYAKASEPLTINGVHLNAHGDEQIAAAAERALFGDVKSHSQPALEKLRAAVLDRNFHWFNRYRATDGYSTYGDRAFLTFARNSRRQVSGNVSPDRLLPTNYEVLQRELEILDVMTSNRDQRIWAVAQGGDPVVDDSNTPPYVTTDTNIPGPNPDGSHRFLSGEEAIKQMTIGKGMAVNLFASEEMFPELSKPVQIAFDTQGRLWVAVWPSYPHWRPKTKMDDKLLVFEDTNGDGVADKCIVFAGGLHAPTGFEFYNGGVLVAQQPDLVFLKDTTGDGKADFRERVLHGFDSADSHHGINSFAIDPGGAFYFQEGTFHNTQVESVWREPVRNINGGVYRFEPRTWKIEAFIPYGFSNPHGHVFNRWGQNIVSDGTRGTPFYGPALSGKTDFPRKHRTIQGIYQPRTRPVAGTEILTSRHFPEEFQGNFLVANVIGFRGILRYRLDNEGSGMTGLELEPIVSSRDDNFRPSDIEVGADGAIYFSEWQNPIIGHMQHNLRDPSRDQKHGRVYRVTYPSRPLATPAKIAGEPVEKLLDLLKEPENRVRHRAKIELGARKSDEVAAAAAKWAAALDKNDPNHEHQMMEALWVHQYHNIVNEELLKRMLRSPEPYARGAATRVLCYWRDRVKDPLDLIKVQANDEHPYVRLEAVRACSFFTEPKATEVALEVLNHPTDYFIKYALDETMATLDRYMRQASAAR